MKQYRTVNNLMGWLTFIIAATVYCLTIEPTASFWDLGHRWARPLSAAWECCFALSFDTQGDISVVVVQPVAPLIRQNRPFGGQPVAQIFVPPVR